MLDWITREISSHRLLEEEVVEETLTTQTATSVIVHTFRVYGSIYAISMFLFTILNWKFPRLFNIRSWSPVQGCKLAAQTTYENCISWFWEVFAVEDSQLHEYCGMDAVCFVRALRFGRNVVLMGCLNAVWLIPLYYKTYDEEDGAEEMSMGEEEDLMISTPTDFFRRVTISNLPSSSKRYIGTLVATYINFLFTMYLIMQEVRLSFVSRTVVVVIL